MRRRDKLSLEALAERADVDLAELMSIEFDAHYLPESRTLYQLAHTFKVSHKKLMGLSGLTKPKDVQYVEEAVRYAARSESKSLESPGRKVSLSRLSDVTSSRRA